MSRDKNHGVAPDPDPSIVCGECDERFHASTDGFAKMVKESDGSNPRGDTEKNVCGGCVGDLKERGYTVISRKVGSEEDGEGS